MDGAFGRNEEDREKRLTVRLLDGDAAQLSSLTRAAFLRRVALGASASSAVTIAVLGVPRQASSAASAPSPERDREILQFALLLEQLQATFYEQASDRAPLEGELRQFAEVVGEHERAHVAYLRRELGSGSEATPEFDLDEVTGSVDAVRAAAVALEDLALAGYNGQAGQLTPETLRKVMRIVSVEGRHAGWIRALAGEEPAPRAADPLPDEAKVRAGLERSGLL